jgi:hypothetical protein
MGELTSVGIPKDQWLALYKEYRPKMAWFILEYFGLATLQELDRLAQIEQAVRCPVERMISILNDIWFRLPDGQFNIMNKPQGYLELLRLIEP